MLRLFPTFSFFWAVLLTGMQLGCGAKKVESDLPDANTLGSPRGYSIVRVITHFHSPYSYDACDKEGLTADGKPNQTCLQAARDAFCKNRINFVFYSDHPSHMADYEMSDLLMIGPKDHVSSSEKGPYANQIGDCENGFLPTLLPGFESKVLSLGMKKHLEPRPDARIDWYDRDTLELRNRLSNEAEALVVVPHSESRDVNWIQSIRPDGMEIYNIHANVDPKIRKLDLGLAPFEFIPTFFSYLADPYSDLYPDYSFMSFVEVNEIYFQKWNTLISRGVKVTGLGGTDSHQNIFPQRASDGERLDSHRRLSRFMSNHLLVHSPTLEETQEAIRKGRGWLVFEGFGSPQGMDFSAKIAGTEIGVGETTFLGGKTARITVKIPHLSPSSPKKGDDPVIRARLIRVLLNGKDEKVAQTEGVDLIYDTSVPGAYRAEISIIPKHLEGFLLDFADEAKAEYRWIVSNHLFLEESAD